MDRYALIDLDQVEPSIVRRRLRRWSKADEEAIRPLVVSLQQNDCLQGVRVIEPRYETNVYPLYYYWAHRHGVAHRGVYERVFDSLLIMPSDELKPHVRRLANTEIDILIEDIEYFAFIEAKEAKGEGKVKFDTKSGVHQLVRQYVQGKILENTTKKKFAFATIGANDAQVLGLPLNPIERTLLELVGEQREALQVVDISWPPMIEGSRGKA